MEQLLAEAPASRGRKGKVDQVSEPAQLPRSDALGDPAYGRPESLTRDANGQGSMLKYLASRISSTYFETTLAPLEYGTVAMRATIFDRASSRSTRTSPGTGRPPGGGTKFAPLIAVRIFTDSVRTPRCACTTGRRCCSGSRNRFSIRA